MDMHCEMIMDEYRAGREDFEIVKKIVLETLKSKIKEAGMVPDGIEARIKEEKSLEGKLELKGYKYKSLDDITDIVGARVITFYGDEVDRVAAIVENVFDIDWDESVDKRKLLDVSTFGYMSLHYICRIPESLYKDEAHPLVNKMRFEIQMRTVLQHVWATINHDTGYKSDVETPKEYLRALSRMAGILELADSEFMNIRDEIDAYRNRVRSLVKDRRYDEIELNGDSFKSYLEIDPFRKLNAQIASLNKAELHPARTDQYLEVLKSFGFKTLADVEDFKHEYYEDAFRLARHQIGGKDIDILASTIGLQDLCIVYLARTGGGLADMKRFYDIANGERERNVRAAKRVLEECAELKIIQQ